MVSHSQSPHEPAFAASIWKADHQLGLGSEISPCPAILLVWLAKMGCHRTNQGTQHDNTACVGTFNWNGNEKTCSHKFVKWSIDLVYTELLLGKRGRQWNDAVATQFNPGETIACSKNGHTVIRHTMYVCLCSMKCEIIPGDVAWCNVTQGKATWSCSWEETSDIRTRSQS